MTIYSFWAYFAIVGIVTMLFALPSFRFLDGAPSTSSSVKRASNIDGIRGFLALSVMIYHCPIALGYAQSGQWVAPTAPFYDEIGNVAVSIFFMITGYLFWQKSMASDGAPNFRALYTNRVFRIAPVYLAAVAAVIAIVLWRTNFSLHQPASQLVIAVAQWAGLGLLGMPDINGYAAQYVLAGVLWTLRYEWLFYISLLFTARFATRLHGIAFPVVAICGCFAASLVIPARSWFLIALFPIGMLVGALRHRKMEETSNQALKSIVALACLAAIFVGWSTPFGPAQVILAGIFFYLICSGATIFGLLQLPAAQRLGHISYSIYILQGLALTLVFSNVRPQSPLSYWLAVLGCASVLSIASVLSYVLIERPGMAAGRRFIKRQTERHPQGIAAHDGA